MAKKKYKSMEEFARACGVSRPTLSKYFADASQVKDVTRKQIDATLKKSNFEPNLFARHLNKRRTRNIGILVPTISDPFYAQMTTLLELELRAKGFWPIQISSHGRPELEEEAVRSFLAFKAVGAIIAPLGTRGRSSALSRLMDSVPVVCFDSSANDSLSSVGNDNDQSMAAMVRYLCRSGEEPIFMDIPQVSRNAGERNDSYCTAMTKEGFSPLIIKSEPSGSWEFERLGFEQMQGLLQRKALPGKTILCANDRFAFGVMAAACAAGLSVGCNPKSDIRIAGHDDHPLSRYAFPPLTTMAQNAEEMAMQSVEMLLSQVAEVEEGKRSAVRSMLLKASLIIRDSA